MSCGSMFHGLIPISISEDTWSCYKMTIFTDATCMEKLLMVIYQINFYL